MQTFLPYPNFVDSARALDAKRLGKQRVEAKQILEILLDPSTTSHWKNHPAVLMWKGYEYSLAEYGIRMCQEWKRRGFKDNLFSYFQTRYTQLGKAYNKRITKTNGLGILPMNPWWLFHADFHYSHQSNLVRKDKKFYRNFFPKVQDNLPYLWPDNIAVQKLIMTTPNLNLPNPGQMAPSGYYNKNQPQIPTAWFHIKKGKTK